MKAKKYWILAAMLVVLCVTALWAANGDVPIVKRLERESLTDLKGVIVAIEGLQPNTKRTNLTEGILKTDTELKLRQYGIKVFTKKEWYEDIRVPCLYLNVNSVRHPDQTAYIYHIKLSLNQKVFLFTEPTRWLIAATWHQSTLGIVPTDKLFNEIRQVAKIMVDEFINDYLAANPKTRGK